MKRHTKVVVVVAALGLVVGLVWCLWPRHTEGPPLRLNVVRQAMVNGKPVVVFQIKNSGWGALQIRGAQLIRGDLGVVSYIPHSLAWTPAEPLPLQTVSKSQKKFSVLAPTNTPVWQLAVLVEGESPTLSLWQSLHQKAVRWSLFHKNGRSIYNAARMSWSTFTEGDEAVITSELITNGVQQP